MISNSITSTNISRGKIHEIEHLSDRFSCFSHRRVETVLEGEVKSAQLIEKWVINSFRLIIL
jgi:hypothetical protein